MSGAGRLVRRLLGFVVHGGSWQLRPYETLILDGLKKGLPESDVAALAAQLSNLDHVKRLHADRMVTFYFFDKEQLPRLSTQEPAFCAARFRLGKGDSATTASVYLHLGVLSSIEFTKPPSGIARQAQLDLKPVAPRRARSVVDDIDAEEHGP